MCMHTILWVLFMQDQQQNDSHTLGFTCINSTWRHTSSNRRLSKVKTHATSRLLLLLNKSNDICPSIFTITHHPQGFAVHLFNFTCLLIFFPYFICSTSSWCHPHFWTPWHLFSTTLHFTTQPFFLLSFLQNDTCHSEGPASPTQGIKETTLLVSLYQGKAKASWAWANSVTLSGVANMMNASRHKRTNCHVKSS